jgi:TonB family protein
MFATAEVCGTVMPFDGFLGDSRRRPLKFQLLGYAASLALHGPPLVIFVVVWLTRALVLDHALDLPDYRRSRISYYEVPVQMVNGIPGAGNGATTSAIAVAIGGDLAAPRGKSGIGKRRSRRPLVLPLAHRRVRRAPAPVKEVAIGPEELVADDDGDAWDSQGNGAGREGQGDGGRGDDEGLDRGGLALARSGPGVGAGQPGGGLGAAGGKGAGDLQARLAGWIPPEPMHKENARLRTKGRGANDLGSEVDEDGLAGDDEALVGPPLPGRPTRVSMNYAAYLRTYEPFPTLPDSCWPPGRTTNTVLLEICVSERGEVSDVVVRESAGEEVDAYLTSAARTWRYRPRVVQGAPQPFCHPIRLVYTRALRFDQRW